VTAGRFSTAALASILLASCAAPEPVPPTTATHVDLNRSNYREASLAEGKPQALINVVQDRSLIYLILFSVPTLTVRA